jgi:hypothetical protein
VAERELERRAKHKLAVPLQVQEASVSARAATTGQESVQYTAIDDRTRLGVLQAHPCNDAPGFDGARALSCSRGVLTG